MAAATEVPVGPGARALPAGAVALRFVSLALLVPVVLLFGTFYWWAVGLESTLETELPSSATLAAAFSLYGSVPVMAGSAAWKARQVEVYLAGKPASRGRPQSFLALLWPVPVVGWPSSSCCSA